MRDYDVYIMANRARTLYVGVTNNIARRVYQHKHMLGDGFTRRYLVDRLVYYEATNDVKGQSNVKNRSKAGCGEGRSL
jgi:putative endonuclease